MDIYMPSIIHQLLATDPSHGRAKIATICVKVFNVHYRLVWQVGPPGAGMGPACDSSESQGASQFGSTVPDVRHLHQPLYPTGRELLHYLCNC